MIHTRVVRKTPVTLVIRVLLMGLTMAAGLFCGANLNGIQSESASHHNHWEVLGPGGGGAMFFPTVSPHDPNIVLVRW